MEIDKSAEMNSLQKLVFQDAGQTMKTNNPTSCQKVVSAMKENKAGEEARDSAFRQHDLKWAL